MRARLDAGARVGPFSHARKQFQDRQGRGGHIPSSLAFIGGIRRRVRGGDGLQFSKVIDAIDAIRRLRPHRVLVLQ
ncbi:hypothetical protein GCM10010486_31600 [Nonomuraea roseoviolacea subsp. carminata]